MAPERPAALPRLELRKASATWPTVTATASSGLYESTSLGTSRNLAVGRRSGSVSACNVVASPGAKAAAVNTWRTRESSPRLTSVHARAARASLVSPSRSSCGRPCRSATRRLSLCSSTQLPLQKSSNRCNSSARPCTPMASLRVRRSRGSSRNNFHARKQHQRWQWGRQGTRASRQASGSWGQTAALGAALGTCDEG